MEEGTAWWLTCDAVIDRSPMYHGGLCAATTCKMSDRPMSDHARQIDVVYLPHTNSMGS
jgi:hypothetical protein